jgi:hypothetical protein
MSKMKAVKSTVLQTMLEHANDGPEGFRPTLGARASVQLSPVELAIREYREASATLKAASAQKEEAEKVLRAALETLPGGTLVTPSGCAELRTPSPVLAYILPPSKCRDPSLLRMRQDRDRLVVTAGK